MVFCYEQVTDRSLKNTCTAYSELVFKVCEKHLCGKSFFFNWDSLHARLNSHCKTWSYKKKKHKKIKAYRKSLQKEPTVKRCLLILDLKSFKS